MLWPSAAKNYSDLRSQIAYLKSIKCSGFIIQRTVAVSGRKVSPKEILVTGNELNDILYRYIEMRYA